MWCNDDSEIPLIRPSHFKAQYYMGPSIKYVRSKTRNFSSKYTKSIQVYKTTVIFDIIQVKIKNRIVES